MSGVRFCKRHKSHFCPCVASWLYSAAAKAAYEENASAGDRRRLAASHEPPEAEGHAHEEEQFGLISQGGEALR